MGTGMHVHMLAAPLPVVGESAPDMCVAEALVAAVLEDCPTCTDQLTALVMRGDVLVVVHLLGAAWRTWRTTAAGQAPGAQVPGRRASHRTLRMLLTQDERLGPWARGLGPVLVAELVEDALALLVPVLSADGEHPVRLVG